MTRQLFAVETRRDERIPTGDSDVTLSADVFLPVQSDPTPAVLTVLPYRKDTGIAEPALRWFAERGYASVVVDMRGTGASDGAVRPPFDASEADDAVAAVEWAAAQDWCDGNVGMWGHSYGAMMSLRAATRRLPSLKAIAPFQCVIDPERQLWHPDGVRGGITLASWGALTLAHHLLPPLHGSESADQQQRWQNRLDWPEPFVVDLFRHGPDHPVWRERVIDPSSITIPTLVGAGWHDFMCEGTISAFERIAAPKRLVAGPWTHTLPDLSPIEPIGFLGLVLQWWDHWLRGVDNGVMDAPPVALYVDGADSGWLGYDTWPPASEQAVVVNAVGGAYRADPTIGTLSGPWWLGHPGVLVDEHDDDMRALSFDGDALPADILISGRPEVTVSLGEGAPDRLVVRLADVDERGRSTFITAGIARALDSDVQQRIVLWPTTYRVSAGHKLRVVVCDSDFPRLWPCSDALEFAVASIEVRAPLVAEDAGTQVAMPAVEPPASEEPPLALWGDRRCRITRDPLRDDVELVVGEEGAVYTPGRDHVLELSQEVKAGVRTNAPDEASIEVTNSASARLGTGEVVEVEVAVHLTSAGLNVRAEVTVDGASTCKRTWEEKWR